MRAARPAPASTTMSRPRPLSFLTVSGVAATRASPSRRSLRMASFMGRSVLKSAGAEHREQDHDDPDSDHGIFDEGNEALPGPHVFVEVGGVRLAAVTLIACGGHEYPRDPDLERADYSKGSLRGNRA